MDGQKVMTKGDCNPECTSFGSVVMTNVSSHAKQLSGAMSSFWKNNVYVMCRKWLMSCGDTFDPAPPTDVPHLWLCSYALEQRHEMPIWTKSLSTNCLVMVPSAAPATHWKAFYLLRDKIPRKKPISPLSPHLLLWLFQCFLFYGYPSIAKIKYCLVFGAYRASQKKTKPFFALT